jgi:hypothetical protein
MAKAKKKKKWVQGAIKNPGALTRQAAAAGMSISEFCAQGNLSGTTQKRCNLAKTLKGMRPKKKK